MNLDHEKGHSLDKLLQNLADTITWCSSRPQPWFPLTSFRSVDIAPEFASKDRKSCVNSVATLRHHALGSGKHSLPERIYPYDGRLLAYFPDENLACGVAGTETEGFLTADNVPPWDTWLAYLYEDKQTNYLVSWVPGKMMGIVDQGIRVNPENCFDWVDVRCPHLIEALRERGLKIHLKLEFDPLTLTVRYDC